MTENGIKIKTEEEIKIMSEGANKLAFILNQLKLMVKSGITTQSLNDKAEELILSAKAKPNFKGYGGYPATLCTSINEEIVHAIPSKRILKDGDIISLDIGLRYKGYNADMAITVPVGRISDVAKRLILATRNSLIAGINAVKIGKTFGDVSHSIQTYAEEKGYSVVKDLTGHGIGKNLHEPPEILNYGLPGTGTTIKRGMVFCLEPMLSIGSDQIIEGDDGFAYLTADRSLSCHFEHEVAVHWDGRVEVLSRLPGEKIKMEKI